MRVLLLSLLLTACAGVLPTMSLDAFTAGLTSCARSCDARGLILDMYTVEGQCLCQPVRP